MSDCKNCKNFESKYGYTRLMAPTESKWVIHSFNGYTVEDAGGSFKICGRGGNRVALISKEHLKSYTGLE